MDPLAERILALIQAAQLSSADRRTIVAALRPTRSGHRSPTAKWYDPSEFLVDVCEWAATLPAEDLPPREQDAARHFACTTRTIGRWLDKAGLQGWEDFLRFWVLATRVA